LHAPPPVAAAEMENKVAAWGSKKRTSRANSSSAVKYCLSRYCLYYSKSLFIMFKLYCLSDTVAIISYQTVERRKSRGTVRL
jgi:hypothetical protein